MTTTGSRVYAAVDAKAGDLGDVLRGHLIFRRFNRYTLMGCRSSPASFASTDRTLAIGYILDTGSRISFCRAFLPIWGMR